MSPKRAVSQANVASRRTRMRGDVERLIAQEDALQLQQDIDAICATLAGNFERVRAVKAFLKLDESPKYNSQTHLHPESEGRQVSRIPLSFLADFFESFACLSRAQLKALARADSKVTLKMLYSLAVIPPTLTIWTTEKEILSKFFKQRMDGFGHQPTKIIWDTNFQIAWSQCGLYRLDPPLLAGTNPTEHTYTSIHCLGNTANLTGVVTVKGDWQLCENYALHEAYLASPSMPDFKPRCYSFFFAGFLPSLEPAPQVALEGGQASLQDVAAAAGAEDDKSTTGSTATSGGQAKSPDASQKVSQSTSPDSNSSASVPPPPSRPARAQVAVESLKG
eukprot:1325547-Amphidinium_carterae.2